MAVWRPWENVCNSVADVDADPIREDFFHEDLEEETQKIIINIYDFLKNENRDASRNQIANRIRVLTKISRSSVYRVINEGSVINHSLKRKM
nr:unnamed protein product [Callosobruchus chinensis]